MGKFGSVKGSHKGGIYSINIKVRLPKPLQIFIKSPAEIFGDGGNIRELIENLDREYPGLKKRICDGKGNIRWFINVSVNGQNIRSLEGEATKLNEGDEVSLSPGLLHDPRRV